MTLPFCTASCNTNSITAIGDEQGGIRLLDSAKGDKDGFKKRDERDRIVWRTRKHDIEEFFDVVRRHGCYKRDLVAFAEALMKKKIAPLFDISQPLAKSMADLVANVDGKGISSMTISAGGESVKITPEVADKVQRAAGRKPKRLQ